MRNHVVIVAILCWATSICSTQGVAHGQWYDGGGYGVTNPGLGYGVGYGLGFGYGLRNYGGAQTAYSANANGMSNLVRAQGAYNESAARAALSYEQARSQYIENQQKAVAAAAASRRVMQAEETKRREEAHEAQVRGAQFAASHRPMPLSASQLDPATGRIQWPAILTKKDFDEPRKVLEDLLATRARNSQAPSISPQITKKAGEMKDALRAQILTIPLPEYTEARRFLESLAATVH